MRFRPSFIYKASSGLLLTMLAAAPTFASDAVSVVCVDISTTPTTRVLELAASSVTSKYYSLSGTHRNHASVTVGSAVGTGQLVDGKLIVTVNASSITDANSMAATLYQFNFDATTWEGPYQSITQQSSFGSSTPATHKTGEAALVVDCINSPLTDFDGSSPTDPTDPTDCSTVADADNDGVTECRVIPLLGLIVPYDCDDDNPNRYPGAPETCGNTVDDDCDGTVDENCTGSGTDADGDGYASVASGGQDCNDGSAAIHPGATDVCNDNIDQDCSGSDQACNEPVPTGCIDYDRDGFNRAGGTNCGPVDCDDATPYINPGMTEVCGNLADENCQASDNNCTDYPQYTDVTSDTMAQVGTDLVWQRGHYDTYSNPSAVWTKAVEYCDTLVTAGGVDDWRLPTIQELRGILDLSQQDGLKIDPRFARSLGDASGYWTATTAVNNSASAYNLDFSDGKVSSVLKTARTFDSLARCVRDR